MNKLTFVFPGQGAQYVGMGESFYKNYLICRQTYEEASDIYGVDISKLCFEGPVIELNEIDKMQMAVITTNIAIYRAYYSDYGIAPQFCFGHSVGEYAALVCSGGVSFSDVIKILMYRGELLKEAKKRKLGQMMIAESIDIKRIKSLIFEKQLGDEVFISGYNSGNQFLISGTDNGIESMQEILLENNSRITPLWGSPPMHSPLLKEFTDEYKRFLEGFRYYPFRFPIISNLSGEPFSDPENIPHMLSYHLCCPVEWNKSIESSLKYGTTMIIEMGPKNLALNLIRNSFNGVVTYCYGQKKDREILNDHFSSNSSYKKDIPEFLGRCLGIAVSVPNKNTSEDEYQKGVVVPYNQIKTLQIQMRESGSTPKKEDMIKTLKLLKQIFTTKRTDIQEQENWIKQLLDETGTFYLLGDTEF